MSDWDVVTRASAPPASPAANPWQPMSVRGQIAQGAHDAFENANVMGIPVGDAGLHGIAQGVNDVMRSAIDPAAAWIDNHIPLPQSIKTLGGLFPTVQAANAQHEQATQQFQQRYGANPQAQIGRTVGNVVASAPLMAAGGAVAAPLRAVPVVGRAVALASGEGGRLSKVVAGAIQGGTGAYLTHAASDAPIAQQVGLGAIAGGALPLAAQAVGAGAKFLGGLITGDAAAGAPSLADKVAMFQQAGVSPTLAATGGKGAATVAKFAAENPIAGVLPRGRMAQSLAETGQAASDIAGQYGDALPPSTMGEGIQGDITRYARGAGDMIAPALARATPSRVATFGDKANALYTRAEGLVGDTAAPIPLTNTRSAIAAAQGAFQNPDLAQRFGNPTLNGIAADIDQAGGNLSWNDAKMLRSNIRERLMSDPALRGTVSDAQVNGIYSALTDDLQNGAQALGGPQASRAWSQANQFYRAGQARINDQLDRVFSAPSGENAYDQVIRAAGSNASADIRKLSALRHSVPADSWGDVASTVISRLGQPNPGNVVAMEPGAFSVNNFATNYAKLSPFGRRILFGGAGRTDLSAALDNLAQVAAMQKGVEAAANHSNTAVAAQTGGMIAGLVNPHTMLPTLGAVGTLGVTGEMMTNPSFVRWLAGMSKSGITPGGVATLRTLAASDPRLMPVYVDAARQLLPQPEQAANEAVQ